MAPDTRWPSTPKQDVYAFALTVPVELDAEEWEELDTLLVQRTRVEPAQVWERRSL